MGIASFQHLTAMLRVSVMLSSTRKETSRTHSQSKRMRETLRAIEAAAMFDEISILYDNQPTVRKSILQGKSVRESVTALFSARFKAAKDASKPWENADLWGHSADICAFRRLVHEDIYVFGESKEKDKKVVWTLEKYGYPESSRKRGVFKFVRDQVPMSEWTSAVKFNRDALFLKNKTKLH
ncbi:hypothetical protein H257_17017 [Aphanomyces astaci]|uniref:Uncharacterized protein n=1 Tax=Aphanomyces astaci TaxID=112090 RepID=W4FGG7_APHAT|nr:hypothetical protein H257_17017 [Aphanomyces astaci]ETV66587.1 hypothetical protein H257_17017 [Aphanomyces astaci]|eukprot:XP_009843958.1 hypothetical protein H257_17017 [Aphanomyces astaci]